MIGRAVILQPTRALKWRGPLALCKGLPLAAFGSLVSKAIPPTVYWGIVNVKQHQTKVTWLRSKHSVSLKLQRTAT